jgi:C4-type Zn-finger protein
MPTRKECPLCGELMDLTQTQSSTQVPGNPKPTILVVSEWVCKDCEYFEEAGLGDED